LVRLTRWPDRAGWFGRSTIFAQHSPNARWPPDAAPGRSGPQLFHIIEDDLEAIYAPLRQVAEVESAEKDGPVDRIRWAVLCIAGIEPFWRYLPPCASI
jgi:hypothetical protein